MTWGEQRHEGLAGPKCMTAVSTNDERGKRELLCLQTLQNAFFYCGYIYRAVGLTLLGLSRRRCVSCTGMAGGPSRTPQGLAELEASRDVSRGQAVNEMLFSETLTNKALCMFLG